MSTADIDFEAVFHSLPGAVALMTPDLVFADANEAYLPLSDRTREQVMGRYLFDVFPDNPDDPAASSMRTAKPVAPSSTRSARPKPTSRSATSTPHSTSATTSSP